MSANENEAEWVLLPDKSNADVSNSISSENGENFLYLFNYLKFLDVNNKI